MGVELERMIERLAVEKFQLAEIAARDGEAARAAFAEAERVREELHERSVSFEEASRRYAEEAIVASARIEFLEGEVRRLQAAAELALAGARENLDEVHRLHGELRETRADTALSSRIGHSVNPDAYPELDVCSSMLILPDGETVRCTLEPGHGGLCVNGEVRWDVTGAKAVNQ